LHRVSLSSNIEIGDPEGDFSMTEDAKPLDEVMTIQEVADYLKLTRQTVYKLLKNGDLKAFKIGRSIRILRSEIKRFIQEKMNSS